MNAVFAAVLLAVVATCSGTTLYSSGLGYGSQYVYSPSAVQYVQPSSSSVQYQYVQPSHQYVASSSLVSQSVPVTYAAGNTIIPSTSYLGYPYAYNYGLGLLKK